MALRCGFKGEMGGKRHYYHVLHLIVNFPLECIQLTLTVSAYTDVHSMMMFCAKMTYGIYVLIYSQTQTHEIY